MKLADLATGSDWIVWIVFAIFAVLSIILLSGHGSWFISGYNTASREEKEKYDEKKLCRTMGIGMSIIAMNAFSHHHFKFTFPQHNFTLCFYLLAAKSILCCLQTASPQGIAA